MISEKIIKEAIERLVEVAKPQKIYLFGSYARGDARKQSDLDFLIVEQALKSRRKEMVRLHDAIRSMRIPVNILVTSESTFDEWVDCLELLCIRQKLRDGCVMKNRKLAKKFLYKAGQDMTVLEKWRQDPDITDEILGFHAQQAANQRRGECNRP